MRFLIRGVGAALVAGLGATAVLSAWPVAEPTRTVALEGDAWRGGYLARASGCIACHTAPVGGKALAGGAPLDTPFGSFVPPNLTPDPAFGIGAWTLAEFDLAVRQGVRPDGQPYYPAFPYPHYANFSDQDIADLWAAFRTVPPVADSPGESDVGFPFSIRSGVKLWRALYLEPPPTQPVLGRSDAWNRGQALVEGAAHCGACHTGRTLLGGLDPDERFAGSDALPGGDKAPPIRADALAERGWTVANLAYALKTGIMPDGDAFGGSMAEVVQNGTAYLDQSDLEAIAIYVLDNGAGAAGVAPARDN